MTVTEYYNEVNIKKEGLLVHKEIKIRYTLLLYE